MERRERVPQEAVAGERVTMDRREHARIAGLGNRGKKKSTAHRAHISEAITRWWALRRAKPSR
jgi:hypothetical protein